MAFSALRSAIISQNSLKSNVPLPSTSNFLNTISSASLSKVRPFSSRIAFTSCISISPDSSASCRLKTISKMARVGSCGSSSCSRRSGGCMHGKSYSLATCNGRGISSEIHRLPPKGSRRNRNLPIQRNTSKKPRFPEPFGSQKSSNSLRLSSVTFSPAAFISVSTCSTSMYPSASPSAPSAMRYTSMYAAISSSVKGTAKCGGT
mmetsp:Transcript_1258/g.2463  ORF Transcript_1258/g.2463 Transcript_1258/m.2463 type:complete len:205 (+) Transcript_1258:1184-1798(+)